MPVNIRTSVHDTPEDGARQVINLISHVWHGCNRVVTQIDQRGYVDWITAVTSHSEVARTIRIAMNIRAHAMWPTIVQELARLNGDATLDYSAELSNAANLMIAVRDAGYAMLAAAPDFGIISLGDSGPAIQWRRFASPERDAYEAACRAYMAEVPSPAESQFQKAVIVP